MDLLQLLKKVYDKTYNIACVQYISFFWNTRNVLLQNYAPHTKMKKKHFYSYE